MLHGLFSRVVGEVRMKLEGGLTERFLNVCAQKNIMLKDIKAQATGISVTVPFSGYKIALAQAKVCRAKVKIIKKTGLCFLLAPYKKRYGIFAGLLLCVICLTLSQNFVWDIRFYECTQEQQARLRQSLYEKGIYEGAVVSKKLLSKVEKELLIENNDFGWITLNYIKGRIVIEKTNATLKPEFFSKETTNVVAAHDGIVRKIDVSGGFVKISEGQSVAKGDVLVSGTLLDTSGNLQMVHAQGKIYADVEKTYEFIQALSYSKELPTGTKKSFYELKIFNKSVRLFNSLSNPPKSEHKLYRYPLVLFGFHFPATVYEYEVRALKEQLICLSIEQATNIAREKTINAILSEFPQAQIFSREETVENLENEVKYSIKIGARVDIGRVEAAQAVGVE